MTPTIQKYTIQIAQIEIIIKGETLKLTLAEALELKRVLNTTFPDMPAQQVQVTGPILENPAEVRRSTGVPPLCDTTITLKSLLSDLRRYRP